MKQKNESISHLLVCVCVWPCVSLYERGLCVGVCLSLWELSKCGCVSVCGKGYVFGGSVGVGISLEGRVCVGVCVVSLFVGSVSLVGGRGPSVSLCMPLCVGLHVCVHVCVSSGRNVQSIHHCLAPECSCHPRRIPLTREECAV